MADTKISDLAELAVIPAVDDEFVIVDKSDTSMAASGTDKRIKASNFAPVIVRKTADETVTASITLQADDHLLFPVLANEVWFVEAMLIVTAANATMDALFGWTVPSGTTMSWGSAGAAQSAQPGFGAMNSSGTAIASLGAAGTITIGTGAVTQGVGLSGIVVVSSTAGNVTLRWAQAVSDGGNLTVKTNSFLRATRLA